MCTNCKLGGGSVMYWAGFGINGTTPLVEIHPKSNSLDYQDVLGQNIVRRGGKIAGRGWIFQHDNAAIHRSASTKDYLERNGVRVLDWPSRSPDLNPIENLWGIMVRDVYAHGRQYNTLRELKTAIQAAWAKLSLDTLRNLINSMKNRVFEVILNGGGITHY